MSLVVIIPKLGWLINISVIRLCHWRRHVSTGTSRKAPRLILPQSHSSLQHDSRQSQAGHLSSGLDVHLGRNLHVLGRLQLVPNAVRRPIFPWSGRSWFRSRYPVSLVVLVPKERACNPVCALLYRLGVLRGTRWTARWSHHREARWKGRRRRLAIFVHCRLRTFVSQ